MINKYCIRKGGKATDETSEGDRKKSGQERSKRRGPPQHPPEDTAGEKEEGPHSIVLRTLQG